MVMANHDFAADDEERWAASWGDSKARRQAQNRLNQRASRMRKSLGKVRRQKASSSTMLRPLQPNTPQSCQPQADQAGFGSREQSMARRSADFSTDTSHQCLARIDGNSTRHYEKVVLAPRSLGALQGLSPSLEDYDARRNFFLAYSLRWPRYGVTCFPTHEPLAPVLFRECIADPLLLDAVIAGIATYRLAVRYHPDDMHTLWRAQIRLSRSLRRRLDAETFSDSVVNAVRLLGIRKCDYSPLRALPRGRFRSVGIEKLGALDLEGQFDYADEHYQILATVLAARGGIEAISLPGLGEKLNRIDIIKASINLERPSFPLCKPFRIVLEEDLAVRRPPLSQVDIFRVDDHFKSIILDLRFCCRLMDNVYDGVETGATDHHDGLLAYYRDVIQHRLLSLPPGRHDMEIARLATLAFTYGVTHPMPRPEPLLRAIKRLACALQTTRYTAGQSAEFLFWAAMVGAVALDPRPDQESMARIFSGYICTFANELNLSSWESAILLLKKFVWLGRACDEGARSVWNGSLQATSLADWPTLCTVQDT